MTPEAKVLKAAQAQVVSCGGLSLRLSFRVGVASGWPDLLCLMPGGRLLFLELKAPGKVPKPLQLHVMEKLRELGFQATWADSGDKARSAVLEAMGAPALPAPRR